MCKDLEYPLAFTAFIYCFLLIIDSGVVVASLIQAAVAFEFL